MIKISLNNQVIELPKTAMLADLLVREAFPEPFAVAVNTVFVPQSAYAGTVLYDGDRVDIVRPVAGG